MYHLSTKTVLFLINDILRLILFQRFLVGLSRHAKGTFTGADSAHTGYFQKVEDVTPILDKVGSLTMETQ